MKSRNYLLFGVGLGLLIVFAIWGVDSSLAYKFKGSVIDPASPAMDFELVDQLGKPYRLSGQKGKIVVLFFGYTHCPDVCPVTLSVLRQVSSGLEKQATNLQFVFVTVDPERDTPEVLREYLGYFDLSFIGLSGSITDLEEVWKGYGVYRAKSDEPTEVDYLVEHTARIYVIDQKGFLKITYPFGFEADKIIKDLRYLLKQGS